MPGADAEVTPRAGLEATLRNDAPTIDGAAILALGPSVRRLARILRPDAVDDVAQQALLLALENLASFEGRGSLKSWVFGIVRNVARADRRREHQGVVTEPSLLDLGVGAGWAQAPKDHEDVSVGLREAFSRLDEEDREILWLRDVEGLSGEETALALGTSLVAMKSRLHRARLKLLVAYRGGAS